MYTKLNDDIGEILPSLCKIPAVLSLLSKQSNNLAQLSDDSYFLGKNLKHVLLVCNTELLTNSFIPILKKINPHASIQCIDIPTYIAPLNIKTANFDVCIVVLQSSDNQKNTPNNYTFSKQFILAPRASQLHSLDELDADIAISLESDVGTIQNAFIRGLKGEKFSLGFIHRDPTIEKSYDRLTPRQKEVLEGIRIGKSNKEIARELNISLNTIKVHCAAIFKELDVTNRTQAALLFGD